MLGHRESSRSGPPSPGPAWPDRASRPDRVGVLHARVEVGARREPMEGLFDSASRATGRVPRSGTLHYLATGTLGDGTCEWPSRPPSYKRPHRLERRGPSCSEAQRRSGYRTRCILASRSDAAPSAVDLRTPGFRSKAHRSPGPSHAPLASPIEHGATPLRKAVRISTSELTGEIGEMALKRGIMSDRLTSW